MALRTPSKTTLRKYGLSEAEWSGIADRQGRVCYVCGKVPASGILHIDHEHVRGWKKMPPEQKRKHVRGLLCWHCNSVWLRRGATPEKLRKAADYLDEHERRKGLTAGLVSAKLDKQNESKSRSKA